MVFNYHIPTKVIFGAGVLQQLASHPLPGKKALIVTTQGTVKRGLADRVQALLKKQAIASVIFDKVLPNPTLAHVDEGAEWAKANACDFIIGLGGGSPIDSAKGTALVAANGGSLWDYCARGTGKGKVYTKKPLPLVVVSTTASTGTEINPIFVISNVPAREKIGMRFPPDTFPALSFIDPELTLSIPAQATAFQGCDILFHAIEGYHSKKSTEISRMYSLEAIKIALEALPRVMAEGNNLKARTELALANLLSGIVLASSSMAAAHSLEHGLSGICHELPHGAGLIMLCPAYYGFWAKQSCAAPALKTLAEAMGKKVQHLSDEEGALKLVETLQELFTLCGVGALKLSDYGIQKEYLPDALSQALVASGGAFNLDPRELTRQEALSILQQAWS